MMTVKELISKLLKCNEDAIVTVDDLSRGNFPAADPIEETHHEGFQIVVLHCANTKW